MGYGMKTVRDLVNEVERDKEHFPNGLDTPIFSGDFEGNYTHKKHEIQYDDTHPECGNAVFLGYEMHEGGAWEDEEEDSKEEAT